MTLTWNAEDKLDTLYHTLAPAMEKQNFDWQWNIRDNGSIDDTSFTVNNWKDDKVNLIEHKNNLSNYSQGNNSIFKLIYMDKDPDEEDYLLLLNNDVVFLDYSSIKNMVDILDNDDEVGVVGAKLNYEHDSSRIQHAGVLFHPSNVGTPFHYRAGKLEEDRDCKNRYYPIVTGAVLLTRAKLFKEIGGLNEKLNWSWDDSFYCMEVSERKKKIVYCGQTYFTHYESASLKKNPANKLFFNQNLKIFVDRWKSKIDKTLVEKYSQDESFALYE